MRRRLAVLALVLALTGHLAVVEPGPPVDRAPPTLTLGPRGPPEVLPEPTLPPADVVGHGGSAAGGPLPPPFAEVGPAGAGSGSGTGAPGAGGVGGASPRAGAASDPAEAGAPEAAASSPTPAAHGGCGLLCLHVQASA